MPKFPQQRSNPRESLPATSNSREPRSLEHVSNACRVGHLAYRTEQFCVAWVKRLIVFHNKRTTA
ncbi:MAG: hypothetical protein EXR98_24200 [Gemmataceae bacterium]|nr:hypothetical protein [Gemmataceae bacterium]